MVRLSQIVAIVASSLLAGCHNSFANPDILSARDGELNLYRYSQSAVEAYLERQGLETNWFNYQQGPDGQSIAIVTSTGDGQQVVVISKAGATIRSGDDADGRWFDGEAMRPFPGWEAIVQQHRYADTTGDFARFGRLHRVGWQGREENRPVQVCAWRDGAWQAVRNYELPPTQVVAVDPSGDRIVLRDITDMPMVPYHHVFRTDTGELQTIHVGPVAVYLFAPDDWFGELIESRGVLIGG